MITQQSVQQYRGRALLHGDSFIYMSPHPALRRYIANYTITFPQPSALTAQYTVMPTASSTMVFSLNKTGIVSGLRGVNTTAVMVGSHANQYHMLLLVEFHPGGLFPFVPVEQHLLLNGGLAMQSLSPALDCRVRNVLEQQSSIDLLVEQLNNVFLAALAPTDQQETVSRALLHIINTRGGIAAPQLARQMGYSHKQLQRLFQLHLGTGIKMFSRIVRVNQALRMLNNPGMDLTGVAHSAGYFDQSHFIRDFKALCGVTPLQYSQNKSIFYNDDFKI